MSSFVPYMYKTVSVSEDFFIKILKVWKIFYKTNIKKTDACWMQPSLTTAGAPAFKSTNRTFWSALPVFALEEAWGWSSPSRYKITHDWKALGLAAAGLEKPRPGVRRVCSNVGVQWGREVQAGRQRVLAVCGTNPRVWVCVCDV